mmetsp:Transcript_25014/g.80841  ORF Transcript_25014/g.80841 Transcript_25014/m.80841 type:complete len:407 (-) Transcript_25014:1291-2511(-)
MRDELVLDEAHTVLGSLPQTEAHCVLARVRHAPSARRDQGEVAERGVQRYTHRLPRRHVHPLEPEENLQRHAVRPCVGRLEETEHHVVGIDTARVGHGDGIGGCRAVGQGSIGAVETCAARAGAAKGSGKVCSGPGTLAKEDAASGYVVCEQLPQRAERERARGHAREAVLECGIGETEAEGQDGLARVEAVSPAGIGGVGALGARQRAAGRGEGRGPGPHVHIKDADLRGELLGVDGLDEPAGGRARAVQQGSQPDGRDGREAHVHHRSDVGVGQDGGDIEGGGGEDDDGDGRLGGGGDCRDEFELRRRHASAVHRVRVEGFPRPAEVVADCDDHGIGARRHRRRRRHPVARRVPCNGRHALGARDGAARRVGDHRIVQRREEPTARVARPVIGRHRARQVGDGA